MTHDVFSPAVREEGPDQQRPEHEAETDHGVQGLLNDSNTFNYNIGSVYLGEGRRPLRSQHGHYQGVGGGV